MSANKSFDMRSQLMQSFKQIEKIEEDYTEAEQKILQATPKKEELEEQKKIEEEIVSHIGTEKYKKYKELVERLGGEYRINTILPQSLVSYCHLKAMSEGVRKARVAYVLTDLLVEDMKKNKDFLTSVMEDMADIE